jgi:DNA repair exonuclease SbcCD ATPase subunit
VFSTRKAVVTTISDEPNAGVPTTVQDQEGGASLEKVRDLLFGGHMRDYDRRFARLEERLVKETSDLREELKKRLAGIEAFIRNEIESLSERLQNEHEQHSTAAQALSRDLSDTTQAFQRKTAQIDDLVARNQRDLRQQLHDQQQQLSDEIRQRADEVLARLARVAHELRSAKTDRSALAALLTEMAMRLNDEFRLPAPEDASRG